MTLAFVTLCLSASVALLLWRVRELERKMKELTKFAVASSETMESMAVETAKTFEEIAKFSGVRK